jgi:hypothetical protein
MALPSTLAPGGGAESAGVAINAAAKAAPAKPVIRRFTGVPLCWRI